MNSPSNRVKDTVVSLARQAAKTELFQRLFEVQPKGRHVAVSSPVAPAASAPVDHSVGSKPKETYGDYWDYYVNTEFPALVQRNDAGQQVFKWPGDEWGDEKLWRKSFDTLFTAHLPSNAKLFAEIGAGSGKYTLPVLDAYADSKVAVFDVSRKYLDVLRTRCLPWVENGRISTYVIDGKDSRVIDNAMTALKWEGQLDCLYSIDAMVHVDVQYLVAYWLSAARNLKVGGKLIMSVSDLTSEAGFRKFIDDVPVCFPSQGMVSPRFEWVSPQMVEFILGRLGFVIEATYNLNNRDHFFVARLEKRIAL